MHTILYMLGEQSINVCIALANISLSYVAIATAGSAAGTMKMSVMGAVLVAISLSIGLLL